jgi:hypothetical protein
MSHRTNSRWWSNRPTAVNALRYFFAPRDKYHFHWHADHDNVANLAIAQMLFLEAEDPT